MTRCPTLGSQGSLTRKEFDAATFSHVKDPKEETTGDSESPDVGDC